MSDNIEKSVLPAEAKKVMFAKILETEATSDSGLASANSSVDTSANASASKDDYYKKGKAPIIEFQAINPSKEKKQESTFVRTQPDEHKQTIADFSSIKGTINTTVNSDGKS